MHYYSHHIGDMIRDTAHLDDHQLATYMRMIWAYYQTEKPFENNMEDLAFAMRSDEKTIRLLLRHYFKLDGEVWRHGRCDKVIAEYHSKSEKAAQSAKTRWTKATAKQTHSERNANALADDANAPKNDANHKPITNNHKPVNKEYKAQAPSAYADLLSEVAPQVVDDWKQLRKTKKAAVTRTVVEQIIVEAGKAGYSLERALSESCARGWTGFKAEWVSGKQNGFTPQNLNKQEALEARNRKVAEQWARDMAGAI